MNPIARATVAAVALASLGAVPAWAAEPSHVLVDPSERHTTTFIGIPKSMPPTEFDGIQQSLGERPGAYLVAWQAFRQAPDRHVRSFIRRNDYPDTDTVGGLVELLGRYDGTPFGLTWNGGLAVTRKDYQHAARTYQLYRDPARDPVHPRNHLDALLRP